MQIIEIYIKNFGKFSGKRFEFSDNVQVFYGENEYGKSTIYAFIKAMFFGLDRGRGRAAANDAFSRYEPWENPNYYAGSMRFISGGKHFYLERHFDRYGRKAVLFCEDDGEELSVENGDLSMLLEEMTEESFENTAAVGQLTAKPGQDLANQLKNCAANFYVSGSNTVNLAKAQENLKIRKKEIERKIQEKLRKQEETVKQYEAQIYYIEKEAEVLRQDFQEKQKELIQQKKQDEILQEETHASKEYFHISTILAVAGMTGILLWKMFDLPTVIGILAIAAVFAALLLAGRTYTRMLSEKLGMEQEKKEIEQSHDCQKLRWECERLNEAWKEKQIEKRNLQEMIDENRKEPQGMREFQKTLEALELAEQKLKDAAEQMKGDFGSHLNDEASKIFEQITEGKYKKLQITEGLGISVLENNRWIQMNRLSRGTQEQIYFALRMAALELLYEEKLPVVLDDAFVFYDEKRLKSTLKWLWEQPRQVIIFSCREREKEITDNWRTKNSSRL
ncbi:MAG: AAA family ATPase [Schaedlerella sp.]|nr:AAA family ATPase [Schaedlerella sp.]